MDVIPIRSLFHFIAFLPEALEPRRFFQALESRPGLVPGKWAAVRSPRPVAFGPVQDEDWNWHVVIDVGELSQSSWKPGFGDVKPPAHRAHAFGFLVRAPKDASGLDRVRATLDLAAAWVDAGASSVAFPSAGVVEDAEVFRNFKGIEMDADRAAALLLSFAMMGTGPDGRVWLRTRGMSQFGMADLCCALPGPRPTQDDVHAAQVLFSSVAPYSLSMDRGIQPGETVNVGQRVWKAGSQADLRAAPPFTGAVQVLVRQS